MRSRIPMGSGALIILFHAWACEPRHVDLDSPTGENRLDDPAYVIDSAALSKAAKNVVLVVHEHVPSIKFDGARIYWSAYKSLDGEQYNADIAALQGCRLDDCENSFVTYAKFPQALPSQVSATYDEYATDGKMLYWVEQHELFEPTSPAIEGYVVGCSVSGCDAGKKELLSQTTQTGSYQVSGGLYWMSQGAESWVQRCDPEDCSNTLENVHFCGSHCNFEGSRLKIQGADAYWIDAHTKLVRASLGDDRSQTVIANSPGDISDFVVDTEDVLWGSPYFPAPVQRCSKLGCGDEQPSIVIANQEGIRRLATSGDLLFWDGWPSATDAGKDLRRCVKSDCENSATTVARNVGAWSIHTGTLVYVTTTDNGRTTSIHREAI